MFFTFSRLNKKHPDAQLIAVFKTIEEAPPVFGGHEKTMSQIELKQNVTLRETKRHTQRTVSLQQNILNCYLECTEIQICK